MRIANLILSGVLAIMFCCTETETSWATLYPDVHSEEKGQSVAANAIDGDTNIGKSGEGQILNCASTKVSWPAKTKHLQYLEIDLQRPYSISAVRVHLRDKPYNQWQNGLVVSLSNTSIETNQTSIGTQCGPGYNNSTSQQSPEFSCWNLGRYVYVVLYSQNPLQVCEVQIFKVLDLTSVGVATLFPPNKEYKKYGTKSIASKAIDGLSSIGNSGGEGAQNCAGLISNRIWNGKWWQSRPRELQYLRIDIGHIQAIHSIRLHLRDGKDIAKYRYARYRDVYGMDVSVGNSYDISQSRYQCGSQYNSDTQSPTFVCKSTTYARYLWMILRNSLKPLFICEVEVYADIRCTVPKNPSNGYYTTTRLTNGRSLSVSCKERYRPSSTNEVICQRNGKWSERLPTCLEITCPPISNPVLENGDLTLSNLTVGATATYTCSIGYKLQPYQGHRWQIARKCVLKSGSDTAEWDKDEPKCIIDDQHCSFTDPQNGNARLSKHRSHVLYFCNNGYILNGDSSRICVNGTLSGEIPSCEAVQCDIPPKLIDGCHEGNVSYGSVIKYSCRSGFRLNGFNTFTCQANGTWNITLLPTCEPVCSRPNYGSKVRVRGLGNNIHFSVNSSVDYECMVGYEMSDDNGTSSRNSNHRAATSPTIKSICLPTQNWSKPAPTCHPVDCKRPPYLENGNITLDDGNTTFQSIAKYSCVKQHYLVGHNSTKCQSNGEWSGSLPECKAFCDPPQSISNGYWLSLSDNRNRIDVGQAVEYGCHEGYRLSDTASGRRTCQNAGTWSGEIPSCQIKDCGQLQTPSNGKLTLKDNVSTYKSVASFKCNKGFYPERKQYAVCQANEIWNITFDQCIPFCRRPKIANGGVKVTVNKHGVVDVNSEAMYNCKKGYFLVGQKVRRCTGSKQWSVPAPKCQIVDCKEPPKPANGSVVSPATVFRSWAEYSCNDGYNLQGSQRAECLATAEWSDGPPFCKPYCTMPSRPANGQIEFEVRSVPSFIWIGKKVTYSCNERSGYVLEGASNTRSCIGALKWSGKEPICRLGDCKEPSSPSNGDCKAKNTNYGGTRTCTCNYGYRFDDDCSPLKKDTCKVAGNVAFWPNEPSCREILCQELQSSKTMSNAQLQYRGNKLDSIASYRCPKCYERAGGSLERTCPCNEQWTGQPLTCKKKSCRPLEKPDHGTLTGSSFECGDKVSYSCDSGYIMESGNETRTCQPTGQWTGKQPICKHVCLGKCDKARECTMDPRSGNFRCTCLKRSQCPSDFSPVCGTDGVTYNNKCLMKVSACEKNEEIDIAAAGECHFGGVCNEPRPSPPKGVTCRAYLFRYWYNSTSNKCERYIFGGCFEGKNSFYTIDDCQETCIETNVCKLPQEKGPCNKNLPRWFFNSTSNQCQSFYYGGCYGNENNFRDNKTCTERCLSSDCNCLTLKRSQAVERNHKLFVVDVISRKSVDGKEAYRIKLLDVCENPKPNWFRSQREDLVVGSKDTGQNCNCGKLEPGNQYKIGVVVSKKRGVRSFYLPLQSYVNIRQKRSDTCNGKK